MISEFMRKYKKMKEGDGNKPREKVESAKRKGGLPAGGEDVKVKKKREVREGPATGMETGTQGMRMGTQGMEMGTQYPRDGDRHPGMRMGDQGWGRPASLRWGRAARNEDGHPGMRMGTQPWRQTDTQARRHPAPL